MGELEDAWKNVTESFKQLGSELKSQYDQAVSDGRDLDEVSADVAGKKEIEEVLDPAAELRADLQAEDAEDAVEDEAGAARDALQEGKEEVGEALEPLGEKFHRDDITTNFDRARDYLEQAAGAVSKAAKDEGTQQAAKDAASAVGDALAATFEELKKALGVDSDDPPSEDQTPD